MPRSRPDHDPTSPPPTTAGEPAGRMARFRRTRLWRWGRWPLGIGALLGAALCVMLITWYMGAELPDEPPQIESSIILDAQGRELAVLQRDENRVDVELDEIDPVVVEALVAAEDRRFYDHDGVDPRGLLRAVRNNIGGGSTQGGSTITQQLVKNSYLTPEKTYTRKIKEAFLAIKLDRRSNKEEILERYLNTVYFGRGTYGIEAASRVYFDTTAEELTTPQAALLIGLLRAPESADPTRDPKTATARRNSVLDDLVEVGDLSRADAEAAKEEPLGATPVESPVTLSAGVGPHVVEWIRQQAIERYGADTVYGAGLKIHTTIDIDDQRAAEEAIAAVLTDPADPQAALVALDRDGGVKAHVGGRDFAALKVDLARGKAGGGSGRQPGSTFKPLVLATALDNGTATLGSTYPAPGSLTLNPPDPPWVVQNYGGTGYGVTDLTKGTANSINTVYAQLMLDVGPEKVVPVAEALGVTAPLPPVPALVLGTGEVSVQDMATTYLTFAREGERVDPYVIAKVENTEGSVIYEMTRPGPRRAIKPESARAVTHALRAVIDDGSGTAAKLDRPAAGKTGTTQNNADAWFAGYTPDYTAVVWMGYPEGPLRQMDDVHGRAVTGGSFPAEIWKGFMDKALADVAPADFTEPPSELLDPPEPAATLELTPAGGPAGSTVEVAGAGFRQCIANWYVQTEPGAVSSAPQPPSGADLRAATITLPAELPPGAVKVVAFCDRGAGPEALAEAVFEIDEPEPPPTTAPPTTAPPTTRPPPSTTAPSSSSSVPSTTSTTTTTTEPDDPDG